MKEFVDGFLIKGQIVRKRIIIGKERKKCVNGM